MIEKINPFVQGKSVLLLGFGREGRSTWEVLKRLGTCGRVDIADQNPIGDKPQGVGRVICGPGYQDVMDGYDVVFKSPGIVLERPFESYSCEILSQTQVFFSLFRDQIIGITGTKGKSTTTSLLYHVLKSGGMKVLLAGNIGIPAFDQLEEVEPDTKIVFELSCHQLEYMTVSPHIALLLNIYEEHLDHYGTMERYVAAKERIYRNQRPEDVLFCGSQCLPKPGACPGRLIRALAGEGEAELSLSEGPKGRWEARFEESRFELPTEKLRLKGSHNYFDIAMAYGVCRLLGMDGEAFQKGILSYEPLPHRLQLVGERDGVRYYDDSISTICETTIEALKTLADADAVLIGGMDRGICYDSLIDFLSVHPIPHIILMEATGERIYREVMERGEGFLRPERLVLTGHLAEAVEAARRLARPGHSCVLSPAAASYGIFKNFEERGREFARLALKETQGTGENDGPLRIS